MHMLLDCEAGERSVSGSVKHRSNVADTGVGGALDGLANSATLKVGVIKSLRCLSSSKLETTILTPSADSCRQKQCQYVKSTSNINVNISIFCF